MQIDENEIRNILAKNIKNIRTQNGYTQEQLAELSNISYDFIKDIEIARTNMSLTTLLSICNALNVTPNGLLKDFFSFTDDNDLARQINLLSDYERNAIYSLLNYFNNNNFQH